jgi:hypothetical protein
MVPSTLTSMDRVDWLPVNHTAQIVVELAGLSDDQETRPPPVSVEIFHGVNSSYRSWSSLVQTVASSLGPGMSVVPWQDWLAALEASAQKEDLIKNPGIKLIEFYKNANKAEGMGLQLPLLETTTTQLRSETLRTLGPVTEDWMRQWMRQWKFSINNPTTEKED